MDVVKKCKTFSSNLIFFKISLKKMILIPFVKFVGKILLVEFVIKLITIENNMSKVEKFKI